MQATYALHLVNGYSWSPCEGMKIPEALSVLCYKHPGLSPHHPTHAGVLILRRVGCILYFCDLLLHTDAQGPSSGGKCEDFFDIPLPCTHQHWQSTSEQEWDERYHQSVHDKKTKGRQGLTLRHLIKFRQSSLYGQDIAHNWTSDLVDECLEWCAELNDLAMLLWIALTIEGAGQASDISRNGSKLS